jgi:hypothetical protein
VYFLKKSSEILEAVKSNAKKQHDLSQRVRLQLRKVPWFSLLTIP